MSKNILSEDFDAGLNELYRTDVCWVVMFEINDTTQQEESSPLGLAPFTYGFPPKKSHVQATLKLLLENIDSEEGRPYVQAALKALNKNSFPKVHKHVPEITTEWKIDDKLVSLTIMQGVQTYVRGH